MLNEFTQNLDKPRPRLKPERKIIAGESPQQEKIENSKKPTEAYKQSDFRTFLSNDSAGIEKDDRILNLGELLKNQPSVANILFSEYAQLVDKTDLAAEEASKLYNEIFFEKKIDKNQTTQTILKRASKLLLDMEHKLKDTSEDDKPAVVKELIEELIKEQITQKQIVEEMKRLAENLNTIYAELHENYFDSDDMESREYFLKEDREYDNISKKAYDDEKNILNYFKGREYKFDSSRINDIIEAIKTLLNDIENDIVNFKKYSRTKKNIKVDRSFKNLDRIYNKKEKGESLTEEEINSFLLPPDDAIDILKARETTYKSFLAKLEKVLPLQIALEQKLDKLMYGKEPDETEEGAEKSLPAAILDKYQKLVELTTKNKKQLSQLFKTDIAISDLDMEHITGRILAKAKECLDNFNLLLDRVG